MAKWFQKGVLFLRVSVINCRTALPYSTGFCPIKFLVADTILARIKTVFASFFKIRIAY